MAVNPWGATTQSINALGNLAKVNEARRRTNLDARRVQMAENREQRDIDYHNVRMIAANWGLAKDKLGVFKERLPKTTKKSYRDLFQWATTPDEKFGGVAIPSNMLLSPDIVEGFNDKEFKTFALGMEKDVETMRRKKDFETWMADLDVKTTGRKEGIRHANALELEDERYQSAVSLAMMKGDGKGGRGGGGKGFEFAASDSNSIGRHVATLFGGEYDPITQRYNIGNKEIAKRAAAVHARAEELFQEAAGAMTHANAVKKASGEYGVQFPQDEKSKLQNAKATHVYTREGGLQAIGGGDPMKKKYPKNVLTEIPLTSGH